MKPITRDDTVHGVEYVTLAEANAAVAEWSERACNLQHELNVALRERDQARFDLATSMRMALEALRLPCDRWNGTQTVIVIAAIKALEQRVGES